MRVKKLTIGIVLIALQALAGCAAEDDGTGGVDASLAEPGGEADPVFATTDYVAYWPLNEASGTAAADSSANAQTLTLAGGAAFTTAGRVGGALNLDGVDDHAVRTSPASALRPTGAFAIAAWVRLSQTDTSGAEVASMGDNYGLRIAADGNVKAWFWDATTYRMHTTTGVNVKDGAWHHLVGQYTGSRVQVFVDGVQRGERLISGAMVYSQGTRFVLGRHGNGGTNHDFRGQLDDVRVYNHPLTPTEAATLAGTTTTPGSLKVLTWNTGGPLGATAIDLVAQQRPQIVFLQEVDSRTYVENLRLRLQATQGGTWYRYEISRGTDTSSSYVAIVSRYPLSNIRPLILRQPGTYVVPCFSSSAVFWAGRSALGATITVNGRALNIVATRMTSEGDRGCAREQENALLKSWANQYYTGPRIYGGDFNMQPYSNEAEYQLMLGSPYPTYDSWARAVAAGTAIAFDNNPTIYTPTRNTRMDYIFYDQSASSVLAVTSAQILDEGSLSDHRMMMTTFRVQ